MTLSFAIAIFVISWWIVLFAILPLGMGAKPAPTGGDPFAEAAGAPELVEDQAQIHRDNDHRGRNSQRPLWGAPIRRHHALDAAGCHFEMKRNSKVILAAEVFLPLLLFFGDRREREERGLVFLPGPGCGVPFFDRPFYTHVNSVWQSS